MQTASSVISVVLSSSNVSFPVLDIILPVGISFHIFQNVGYTTDVYRREVPVEKHFGHYALFASFFPQLVAGPIERTANLLPQLKKEHRFVYGQAASGLRWILIGLFKKVAIADTIAIFVDNVYNDIDNFNGLALVLATILFAFQIYCDFSGYSDIALGSARMLGIELMVNFRSPYYSLSIADFWRRWHISLSSWFRDNVYIPLGGSRVKLCRHLSNLLITFILSGIWHGAGWNFIIWGGLHGLYLCAEVIYEKLKLPMASDNSIVMRFVKRVFVFIFVGIAWVFFRADSINDAFHAFKRMLRNWDLYLNFTYVKKTLATMGFTKFSLVLTVLVLIMLFAIDYFNFKKPVDMLISKWVLPLRWGLYFFMSIVLLLCAMFTSQSQTFIYFQF